MKRNQLCCCALLLTVYVGIIPVSAGRSANTRISEHQDLTNMTDKRFSNIDSLLASFPQEGPGGVVAVVEDSRLIYSGAYGYAQVEWEIPNTPDACYRIGSLTKTFTALAVMQLAEQRKLNPDDRLKQWFPDLPLDERITVAHILSHTSGILPGTAEPEFAPGEKMNYSNYGYILLGQLIEKASGTTFEQYLHNSLFIPLGMQQSGYDHHRNIIPRRVAGYEMLNGKVVNAAEMDMEGAGAAGGLYASSADLVLFARALNGHNALPEALIKASMQPYILHNGESGPYGYGWMISNYRGWRQAGHGGDINGFNCFFSHFPDKQRTVIVLQNLKMQMNNDWSNGSRLAHRIVDMLWEDELEPETVVEVPIDLPVEELQHLAGTYAFENAPGEMIAAMGPALELFVENNKLMVRDKNGTAVLEAVGQLEFILPGIDIRILFEPGTGVHPAGLNMSMMRVRNLYARRMKP